MNQLKLYDDTTPVSMLTVGQLREIIQSQSTPPEGDPEIKKKVCGIKGIMNLFNCGETRAHELKNTVIKGAVSQHGRTIVVDVAKALALFEQSGKLK